jgi:hypothetical protein
MLRQARIFKVARPLSGSRSFCSVISGPFAVISSERSESRNLNPGNFSLRLDDDAYAEALTDEGIYDVG